ncbi:MAG: DNA repair protein RecO [Candidatus Cryptobacteroides sp.]
MTENTDFIVLHTTKYGENAVVVHTLSERYGRRGFLVRGLGKKPVMSLLQPLNVLEADVNGSTRSNLYTASNLAVKYPLTGIRNNLYKNAMTMFISEVLYRVIREGEGESGLYGWCERNILLLDAVESDFSNFHLRFLLELAVTLGFSPESTDLLPFVEGHYPVVERFMKEPFAESMLIPLSGKARNEIADGLLRYLEFHTESHINVASLKVLRELFG